MDNATDRQRTYILRFISDMKRYANEKSAHGRAVIEAATNFTSKDIPHMTKEEASEVIEILTVASELFGANQENVMKAVELIDNMRFSASMEVPVSKYD